MRGLTRLSTIIIGTFLLMAAAGLDGADEAKPELAPNQVDAQAVFARQAGSAPAPAGATPALVGAYLWGGRADATYRPFFQWELRLTAGQAPLAGLKARITTLGPSHQVLNQGPWKAWPAVAANASVDVDYRLNCTIFPAYQLELAWNGGAATFLAPDKGSIPLNLGPLADQGFVVAVNLNNEMDTEKPGSAEVTWSDWNVGGKPAHGIVHTIHLYNDKGVELKKLPVALPAAQVLKPGAVLEQHQHLSTVPFATLSMSVDQADDQAGGGEAQGFTNAKDVEVAFVHAQGSTLLGKVRNGLDEDQDGLVVTLTLQDAHGADLTAIDIPVGHLAAGATADLSAHLDKPEAFVGYASSWKATTVVAPPLAGAAPGAAGAAAAPATPAAVDTPASATGLPGTVAITGIPGLTFSPSRLEQAADGVVLYGSLSNHSGKTLEHLHLHVEVVAKGEQRSLAWRTASLADGAAAPVVLACGLPGLEGLTISGE